MNRIKDWKMVITGALFYVLVDETFLLFLLPQSCFRSVSVWWPRSSKEEKRCHLARVQWSWYKFWEMGDAFSLLYNV